MIKQLVWPDGTTKNLTPLSFEEWRALGLWTGADDTSYAQFLHHNKLHEVDSFSDEALAECRFRIAVGEYNLEFDPAGENDWLPMIDCIPTTEEHQSHSINDEDHCVFVKAYKPDFEQ